MATLYNITTNGVSKLFKVNTGSQGPRGKDGQQGESGVGISSIEVKESHVDGGDNLVVINLTDDSSKAFTVKNGSKGEKGESTASITEVSATIDGNRGTPSVECIAGGTSQERTLTFNFHNLKGDNGQNGTDGKDGTSAGFGIPTATVDSNSGTPSVEITTSGEDTSKVFNFSFHNLKGEKGADGKDGTNGTNGTTPVKGTDYFTEEEKTELINELYNKIENFSEGAF